MDFATTLVRNNMHNARIPILGFAAFSGVGKTTLLTQLIPLLKQKNLRIGLIKHSHHNFNIDKPGKDSFRFREAGADSVMLISRQTRALITEMPIEQEPDLNQQFLHIDQSNLDLILVEGFKAEAFPKIEIHRPSLKKPLLYPDDNNIIAVASDIPMVVPAGLPNLNLNRASDIVDFIFEHIMNAKL